ncbi:hypothetical protein FACS1894177_09880 [Bacteroidia bacterium]|nr:hypothetical protein FACS1894177_09880 [Bacteroidia bacterium]
MGGLEPNYAFILFIYLLGLSNVFSQSIPENNKFIPPSPTIAELGKYGMIPVSHYTGVPNISIPLYTIECGSLKLPISLSYHAGGIRVEQIASWVGLGWSLNAGGIISASVMGKSDFDQRMKIKDWNDIRNNRFPTEGELISIVDGYTDSQPDIYTYNFNGHSGQFILDTLFQPHEIRNNKQIKIIPNKTNKEFTIIDDMGISYEFKSQELTTTDYYQSYSYNAGYTYANFAWQSRRFSGNTAWFLTRVISPNQADILTFTYADETQEYDTKVEGTIHRVLKTNSWLQNDVLN